MTTYRLIEVDDHERTVGVVETIEIPPNAALVAVVSPELTDRDLVRVRDELRDFFKQHGWERPIGVIRAGDLKFVRLVPIEVPG